MVIALDGITMFEKLCYVDAYELYDYKWSSDLCGRLIKVDRRLVKKFTIS